MIKRQNDKKTERKTMERQIDKKRITTIIN